jgi:small-conductance mechanosensitive channel
VSGTRAFVIRRFELGPLAQWGFIAGALAACLPALVCSWFFFTLVQALRGLLVGWRDVGFEVLGQRLSFNLIEMLNLRDALQTLTNVAAFGVLGIVLLALLMATALGVFGAIVMALLGAFYNATGRLRVEVEPVEKNVQTN